MNESTRNICINLTRRCNLNCPGCYVSDLVHHTNRKGEMDLSLEKIKQIVDLKDIDGVYLTGGEPLCHPEIKEIVDYFYMNGKKVSIATNGLLFTEELFRFLDHKGITLLISLREEYKDVFAVINRLASFDIEVVCYHLPTESSPNLLVELIQKCPSVRKIKLLYDSKDSPNASSWFSILNKIHKKINLHMNHIEVMVELGFLPKQNEISKQYRKGAFDRIHISTEGLFYNCPLMVLGGDGVSELPPKMCTPKTCPVLSKRLDDEKFSSVCCFLVADLNTAILLAKWGGIK